MLYSVKLFGLKIIEDGYLSLTHCLYVSTIPYIYHPMRKQENIIDEIQMSIIQAYHNCATFWRKHELSGETRNLVTPAFICQ